MDRKCLRSDSLCTDLRGELARAEGEDETEHWISSRCLKKIKFKNILTLWIVTKT